MSLRILLVPDHMAIGAIDRLDPRKVAGCTCLLRHFVTEFISRSSSLFFSKTASTQEIGVIPLLWHHMWPPRNIGLIFSSLETHSLPWETKRMAARRQFEAKLCFLSLPQKQSKLKNWVVNKSFVVWHKCRRKLQISAQNNKASKSASGK